MSEKPVYTWDGNWKDPGRGQYVIEKDGVEMEPAAVCSQLQRLDDLIEQLERLAPVSERTQKFIRFVNGTFDA